MFSPTLTSELKALLLTLGLEFWSRNIHLNMNEFNFKSTVVKIVDEFSEKSTTV